MRRIPIEFPPAPGEALDSWLLAYAARLQTPLGNLTDDLGIGSVFVTQPAVLVALGRPAPDLTRLVEATRLPAANLEALWGPLARYAALMERRFGNRRIARAARPMLWSRFCKACLAENAGRWAVACCSHGGWPARRTGRCCRPPAPHAASGNGKAGSSTTSSPTPPPAPCPPPAEPDEATVAAEPT